MQAYFESFVFTQIYFEAVLFGSKIFAMCLICFSQAIFSSPLISNLVTITSKFFQIIANIWVFLGILVRLLSTSFLLFCLLECPRLRTFSVNNCVRSLITGAVLGVELLLFGTTVLAGAPITLVAWSIVV